MNRALIAGLLLTVCLAPLASAQGKKGKGKVTTLQTSPGDYQALGRMKGIFGRVLSIDPTKKTITLNVEYQLPQVTGSTGKNPIKNYRPKQRVNRRPNIRRPINRNNRNRNIRNNRNRNNGNSAQQLARQYQQILRIQNPAQRAAKMRQFMAKLQQQKQKAALQQLKALQQQARRAQQQLARNRTNNRNRAPNIKGFPKANKPNVKMIAYAKEFTLRLGDKVRVARKNLGVEFDDKGNIKQYTKEELKKRMDDKLPGFKAAMEDVLPGQLVYVYIAPAKAKGKRKAGIADIVGDPKSTVPANAPTVANILIMTESDLSALPKKKKK